MTLSDNLLSLSKKVAILEDAFEDFETFLTIFDLPENRKRLDPISDAHKTAIKDLLALVDLVKIVQKHRKEKLRLRKEIATTHATGSPLQIYPAKKKEE